MTCGQVPSESEPECFIALPPRKACLHAARSMVNIYLLYSIDTLTRKPVLSYEHLIAKIR